MKGHFTKEDKQMENKYLKRHLAYHLLGKHKLKPQKDISTHLLEYLKQKHDHTEYIIQKHCNCQTLLMGTENGTTIKIKTV